jgi:hypothetical protein
LITNDRVGIEIELEGITSSEYQWLHDELNRYWIVKDDGSLRNGGIELVSRGGTGGATLIAALDLLENSLSRIDYNASWRCSTHIHVNMLDATMKQCVMFLLVYTCVEPVLFHFCNEHRQSNNFCIQNKDCLSAIKSSMHIFHTMNAGVGCTVEKYMALNLLPLFHPEFGTVEFRGSHAITSKDELIGLTNRMLAIKRLCMSWTGSEEELINHIEVNGWRGVFQGVIPEGMECCSLDDFESAVIRAWSLLKSYTNVQKALNGNQESQPVRRRSSAWQPAGYTSWVDSGVTQPQPINNNQVADQIASNTYRDTLNYLRIMFGDGEPLVDAFYRQWSATGDWDSVESALPLMSSIIRGLHDRFAAINPTLIGMTLSVPLYAHYECIGVSSASTLEVIDRTVYRSQQALSKIRILNGTSSVGKMRLSRDAAGIPTQIYNWIVQSGASSSQAYCFSLAMFFDRIATAGCSIHFKNRTELASIAGGHGYRSEVRGMNMLSAFWMFKRFNLFDRIERYVTQENRTLFTSLCNLLNNMMKEGFAIPTYRSAKLYFHPVAESITQLAYSSIGINGNPFSVIVQRDIQNSTRGNN